MTDKRKQQLDAFIALLEENDREGAVAFALGLLERGDVTIPELYEEILAPSLNRIKVPRETEDELIWREHLQSAIVQAVMGACWPFLLLQRQKYGMPGRNTRVLLVAPEEEYHEIGIRMGMDFFVLLGYQVDYIGCNTPRDTMLNAVKTLKPDLVCISVTNYLNLAQLPAIIAAVKANKPAPRVFIAGSALARTGKNALDFGADGALTSFESIREIREVKQ